MSTPNSFTCSRTIEIDAAHRVPDHKSKCNKVHGHRYKIIATVQGGLHQAGEQAGMIIDFGFLKDLMIEYIHDPCDHGLILWQGDPLVRGLTHYDKGPCPLGLVTNAQLVRPLEYKIYVTQHVPTAENLARLWYNQLSPRVQFVSEGIGVLLHVDVYETPNCVARYPV